MKDAKPDTIVTRGGSIICGPLGDVLAGPLIDERGILTVKVRRDEMMAARMDFDPTGHYARPDGESPRIRGVAKIADSIARSLCDHSVRTAHGPQQQARHDQCAGQADASRLAYAGVGRLTKSQNTRAKSPVRPNWRGKRERTVKMMRILLCPYVASIVWKLEMAI